MMKLILVEDEMIVRVGIKSLIPWNELNCVCVGEAANGVEALELIEKHRPDLILTDILMPEMDGVTLLKHVRERYPHMKVIILSCHNDFHYVQQALRLGAADYLMKLSLKPAELRGILSKMKLVIDKEKESRLDQLEIHQKINVSQVAMKERCLWDALKGRMKNQEAWNRHVADWKMDLNGTVGIVHMQINDFAKRERLGELKNADTVLFAVTNIAQEIIRMSFHGEVIKGEKGEVVLLVGCRSREEWKQASLRLVQHIQESVLQFVKVSMTAGISDELASPPRLQESYNLACQAYAQSFFYSKSAILSSEVFKQIQSLFPVLNEEEMDLMANAIGRRDAGFVKGYVTSLVGKRLAGGVFLQHQVRDFFLDLLPVFDRRLKAVQKTIREFPEIMDYYPYEAIASIETIEELISWMMNFIDEYFERLSGYEMYSRRKEIMDAQQYICDNLGKKLTVDGISEHVGYTESYFSHLYKKETGESIVECITRLRLERAKDLLKTTDMKVYEIVEKIGFSDSNYFSRQFKRYEGMTPLDYRQRFEKR
ncbi:MAG: two-component system response regulator [Paenibacillaceae bacterium]|jgi:two-component system response regulator YesN|nr:two-component system response regulator [Paenibacillaceae bacterium]